MTQTLVERGAVAVMTNNLQDNLRLLDMIEEIFDTPLDTVDFNWMDDHTLISLAFNQDAVDKMDHELKHDLIRELARRLDDYREGEDD